MENESKSLSINCSSLTYPRSGRFGGLFDSIYLESRKSLLPPSARMDAAMVYYKVVTGCLSRSSYGTALLSASAQQLRLEQLR